MDYNTTSVTWIIGSMDPEIEEIIRMLKEYGCTYYRARDAKGDPLTKTSDTYETFINEDVQGGMIISIGCRSPGSVREGIKLEIEHVNPSIHMVNPSDYWKASAIGQICGLLGDIFGIMPVITPYMRMISIVSYHTESAFRGQCPDLDVDMLQEYIRNYMTLRMGVTRVEADLNIEKFKSEFFQLPILRIHGLEIFDANDSKLLKSFNIENNPWFCIALSEMAHGCILPVEHNGGVVLKVVGSTVSELDIIQRHGSHYLNDIASMPTTTHATNLH